jgi:hypothetical protein
MSSAKSSTTTSSNAYWTALKWSVMAAAIFWTLVYRLSEQRVELSGFVYANF